MKPTDAVPITQVASHPTIRERREIVNWPITVELVEIFMSKIMIGTATMALRTADQTSAFMGQTLSIFATAPKSVAAAMVP